MEIQYTFEEKDFKGLGQIVVKSGYKVGDPFSTANYCYKIGYSTSDSTTVLISLTDGCLIKVFHYLSHLVDYLNINNYHPATKDELDAIAKHGNRFV